MGEISANFRVECFDLTLRKLKRWIDLAENTYETLDVPVLAKRRDDGTVFLVVTGGVE